MRIKLHVLVALFICFLRLVSSFEAQLTLRGEVANVPIGEIQPAQQDITAGQAGTTAIDFDDLVTEGLGTGGPIPVTNQYASQGVTFNSPVAIDFSKGDAIPGFAHSGTNAIEQCYAAEFCTAPIEIRFDQGQARVKVWVGYDSRIRLKG